MEIIKCGTIVILKLVRIEGMVTCSSIRFEKVVYEVSYFINGEQKLIWVNEAEFEVKEPESQKIGFKKYANT
jgi:hypothetical protein